MSIRKIHSLKFMFFVLLQYATVSIGLSSPPNLPFTMADVDNESDPAFLDKMSWQLQDFFTDPSQMQSAFHLRMRIRERLRLLTAGTIPVVSHSAHIGNPQPYLDPMEKKGGTAQNDNLVRDALIQGTSVQDFPIYVSIDKKTFQLSYSRKPEYERRVSFTLPQVVKIIHNRTTDLKTTELVVADMLDTYFKRRWFSDHEIIVSLAPMGSQTESFHNRQTYGFEAATYFPTDGLRLNKIIRNNTDDAVGADNFVTYDYWVADQNEFGNYWDTADRYFEKMGIAIRVKSWQTNGELTGRSFFVKVMGPTTEDWTNRDEIEIKLPLDGSISDSTWVNKLLPTVMDELNIAWVNQSVSLRTIVQNHRMALRLIWGGEIQVGFVTIDSFTNSKALENAGNSVANFQWEIELFPEFLPLYNANKAAFGKLFAKMEKRYNGTLNPTPKYLTKPPSAFSRLGLVCRRLVRSVGF